MDGDGSLNLSEVVIAVQARADLLAFVKLIFIRANVLMCTDDSPCELVLDAYFINWCMGESKVTNIENIHRSQYLFSIRMIPIR